MRIVLMGTPDLARTIFDEFLSICDEQGYEIVGVYSQPPRKAGRGKKLVPSPVHTWAEEHDLPVFTPLNFKAEEDRAAFAALEPDVALVAAYGLLLPREILDIPTYGCLNVHGSLLPRWRGAAPIQRAIMEGDEKTGVMIMQMEEGLDTGPVYATRTIDIPPTMTAGELFGAVATSNNAIITTSIDNASNGIAPEPQQAEGERYAKKISKDEARIDWTKPAKQVDGLIRGISPFPCAWFELEGERIKVLRSQLADGSGPAGTALDDALTIACGDGAVQLLELQRAGKKPMKAADLLRGLSVPRGTLLASAES